MGPWVIILCRMELDSQYDLMVQKITFLRRYTDDGWCCNFRLYHGIDALKPIHEQYTLDVVSSVLGSE